MVVLTFYNDEIYAAVCSTLMNFGISVEGNQQLNQLFFKDTEGVYPTACSDVDSVGGLWLIKNVEVAEDVAGIPELPAFLKPMPAGVGVWDWHKTNNDKAAMKEVMTTAGMSEDMADAFIKAIDDRVAADVASNSQQGQQKKKGKKQSKSSGGGKGFQYGEYVAHLMNDFDSKYFRDGFIRIYDDGGYGSHDDMFELLENEILKAEPNATSYQRSEVYKSLKVLLKHRDKSKRYEPDPRYIRFNNCLYNLETGRTEDFSPDKIVTNRIPHDYNQSVKVNQTIEKFFHDVTCGDDGIKELLLQFIGYCMYSDITAQNAFILTGKGANGKSTFLDMLREMLGEENTSELMIKDFSERFSKIKIVGKLANLGDDIDDKYVDDPSTFKILSAGGRLTVEQKFMDPVSYTSKAKMIFTTNRMPKINDRSDAIMRRLIIVPFKAKFDKNSPDYDPNIGKKLADEDAMEYLIVLAVEALKRFLAAGSTFPEPQAVLDEKANYEQYNNPIVAFICDTGIDKIVNNSVKGVYEEFVDYCASENIRGLYGKKQFNKALEERLPIYKEKKNGVWMWRSENYSEDEEDYGDLLPESI